MGGKEGDSIGGAAGGKEEKQLQGAVGQSEPPTHPSSPSLGRTILAPHIAATHARSASPSLGRGSFGCLGASAACPAHGCDADAPELTMTRVRDSSSSCSRIAIRCSPTAVSARSGSSAAQLRRPGLVSGLPCPYPPT